MNTWVDLVLILLILTNLQLLGSSRLVACIRTVAIQALLLGLLPVLMHWGDLSGVIAISVASTAIKAGVLPWLLRRALREAQVSREVEPLMGFGLSLVLGIVLLVLSIYLAGRLPLPTGAVATGRFAISVALFTSLAGLLLIVSRRKALMQVLGYLAMENGIYAFGLAFAVRESLIVELGILLDVFVAVFVMGIMIYHINREFDHIDTDRLSALRD
jgi:hydrogenase-4 component E